MSRLTDRELRREWLHRILDHDGVEDDPGGIERWLMLTEGLGLNRDYVMSMEGALPATRFAVESYVRFVYERPTLEGIASSLTELFAPQLMTARLAAFEQKYSWIDASALSYFRSRPPLATRDSEHGLELVHKHCRTRDEQERAVAALRFKCDLLWAQLDALYYHYTDRNDTACGSNQDLDTGHKVPYARDETDG